jgi:hypothetical protein
MATTRFMIPFLRTLVGCTPGGRRWREVRIRPHGREAAEEIVGMEICRSLSIS